MSSQPDSQISREAKPLAGRRVLVTRALHQASQLSTELERLGAEPVVVPVIGIAPPCSYEPLDAALRVMDTFDWIIFTSANAVEAFGERLALAGIDAARPAGLKIAAIGPSTARAIEKIGLKVALLPEKFVAESLADALRGEVANGRVLLVRAEVARDVLPDALTTAGASVEIVDAYRNVVPEESIAGIRRLFSGDAGTITGPVPDAATFTSSSSARNFFALVDEAGCGLPSGMKLISIGPVTSATLRELGHVVDAEAEEATIPALALAVAACLRK